MLSRSAIKSICFLQVFLLFLLSNAYADETILSNDVYTVTLNPVSYTHLTLPTKRIV